jgi:sugar/nucleoside kinase (ribokinase family)
MSRQSPAVSGDTIATVGYRDLGRGRLLKILESLRRLNILIIGDACLDVYWHADMKLSVLSRETPHFPLPVVEERFSPGACANAAACLSALGVNSVKLLTVIGQDWRGRELLEQCEKHGIDTSLVISSSARVTPAYCKPLRKGISDVIYEDPRIDFENRSALPEELEAELAARLREAAAKADAIAVSDQLEFGVVTSAVREVLSSLSRDGMLTVADSRTRIALFTDIITKPNEYECLAAIGLDPRTHPGSSGSVGDAEGPPSIEGAGHPWSAGGDPSDRRFSRAGSAARILSQKTGAPVCMTLGPDGSVWASASDSTWVAGVPVTPPVDTVGAGDCFLSALTVGLAAGCTSLEAMRLANLASAVIVKKIGTTGTATPEEILDLHEALTANSTLNQEEVSP